MTRALLQQALDALESAVFKNRLCDVAVDAIRAHLAQPLPQGEPAWHDAPTVPGLWIAANGSSYMVTPEMIGQTAPARRWYGPIPQENK